MNCVDKKHLHNYKSRVFRVRHWPYVTAQVISILIDNYDRNNPSRKLKLDHPALEQRQTYIRVSLANKHNILFNFIFALHLIMSEINQLAGNTESDREII